jgi:hypothetical protein
MKKEKEKGSRVCLFVSCSRLFQILFGKLRTGVKKMIRRKEVKFVSTPFVSTPLW